MDMVGERQIAAPRGVVWDALNDPALLKASIPGCDSLERVDENGFKATASVKIGPISAKFAGKVALSNIDAPNSYTISGEGQGGVAGFAKGGADVALEEDGLTATVLRYKVQAQVGGKIAQLGARLIDASAKQMADQFFDRFSALVTARAAPETAALNDVVVSADIAAETANETPANISLASLIPATIFGLPLPAWGAIALAIVIFVLLFGSYL